MQNSCLSIMALLQISHVPRPTPPGNALMHVEYYGSDIDIICKLRQRGGQHLEFDWLGPRELKNLGRVRMLC